MNGRIERVVGLRRSQRVCNQRNVVDEHVEECGSVKSLDELDLTDDENDEKGVDSCEQILRKRERRSSIGPEAVIVEGDERKANDIGIERKRKRDEEECGITKGWTKEQELALQRAYFVAKPTPNFWKKVSKLVFFYFFDSLVWNFLFFCPVCLYLYEVSVLWGMDINLLISFVSLVLE